MQIGRWHRDLEPMSHLATRDLSSDDPAALALAVAAGPHGVYVHNALVAGEGDGCMLDPGEGCSGLVWFGPRGNVVVLADAEPAAAVARALANAIHGHGRPWRIVMGPAAVVDQLRDRLPSPPLAWRDQVYYTGRATSAVQGLVRGDVRKAERVDRDRLVQATLLLNASDLNVDPARVDRRWLRDSIDERIVSSSTRVIGPLGAPSCKLDFGSNGPGGLVLEGVFTFSEHRGRGLAAGLVATCLQQAPGDVSLHVGKHNRPARCAYERAGMTVAGGCRLLLIG
jgi:predicted GNAT family acetyltransferase